MQTLPPAPSRLLDAQGQPALGRYLGFVDADWAAAPVGRLRRTLASKRWLYAGIATPACFAAVAIIDLGWVASAFTYLFDRERRSLLADLSWTAPPGTSRISAAAGAGARASFRWRGVELGISRAAGSQSWTVRVESRDLTIDAALDAAAAPPTMCAIAHPPGAFGNCTHKTLCLPARGEAESAGRRFSLDGGTASLDHTSGLLARDTQWRWASATRPGLGLNLVEGFNGEIENTLWLDGQVIPLGAARFEFDAEDPMRPWRITTADGIVDLEFRPEGKRGEDKNLLVAVSRYVQPIGTFHGTLRPPGGKMIAVADLTGVTENHVARW